mmetsp:Transcript_8590/g.28286  ORF Transcript_8590/g.28286 Transcript_8590/m.28286 type:complete len:222 (+) Transcript_8590:1352-2017(+)
MCLATANAAADRRVETASSVCGAGASVVPLVTLSRPIAAPAPLACSWGRSRATDMAASSISSTDVPAHFRSRTPTARRLRGCIVVSCRAHRTVFRTTYSRGSLHSSGGIEMSTFLPSTHTSPAPDPPFAGIAITPFSRSRQVAQPLALRVTSRSTFPERPGCRFCSPRHVTPQKPAPHPGSLCWMSRPTYRMWALVRPGPGCGVAHTSTQSALKPPLSSRK